MPAITIFWRSRPVGGTCAALGSPLDSRFVGYLLEWGYRHLHGAAAPGGELWSPPFFYPVRHVLAYSENLFAGYLWYFPLRWIGLAPSSSLFVFHLVQLSLTPLVAYLCLRALRLGRWPSLVGAAVFSWGWIRYSHYGHIQFAAGYPIPLFFTALYFGFHRRRPWAIALAAWTFLLTWHLSLYTAIFLVLGGSFLLGAQLVVPRGAREIADVARSYGRDASKRPYRAIAWLLVVTAALLLVLPSAIMYADAHQDFGSAPEAEVRTYWGSVLSWIRPPENHPLLGGFHDLFPAEWGGFWEKRVYLGWLALVGLLLPTGALLVKRRRAFTLWPRSLVVTSAAGLAILLIFSSYGGRWPEAPFWFLHSHFPGLSGLRAPSRIAFVVAWFTALSLAAHLDRLAARRLGVRTAAAGVLGLALLAESLAPLPPITNRCEEEALWKATESHLCPQIPRDEVGTLLFLPAGVYSVHRLVQHTLAMQLSLECGLNVVNGYSGRQPPLLAPLLGPDPHAVPCDALREVVDKSHERSGEGVLVHVDLGTAVGLPDYPVEAVRECLSPCLGPETDWYRDQPGRPAEVMITNPGASCR